MTSNPRLWCFFLLGICLYDAMFHHISLWTYCNITLAATFAVMHVNDEDHKARKKKADDL